MNWRPAHALTQLLNQVNAAHPGRNKASDGIIGDARHSASQSDHNPDDNGVVHAMDITHDVGHGLNAGELADTLIESRDPRIAYIISNGRIASSTVSPWKWRRYDGSNKHTKHVHISVRYGSLGDDTRAWKIGATGGGGGTTIPGTLDRAKTKTIQAALHVTVDGVLGEITVVANAAVVGRRFIPNGVKWLQARVGAKQDGDWGPKSEAARTATIKAIQRALGVAADGDWGPRTQAAWETYHKANVNR